MMKRILFDVLLIVALLPAGSIRLLAQSQDADRFLENVSRRPVGDEVERDQFLQTNLRLNSGAASEVERVLPAILLHVHTGNEVHERGYAAGFLLGIAMRPDGAKLLSSDSEQIAPLLLDRNSDIQNAAIAIVDYVIASPETNRERYLSAMHSALQRRETPQDVALKIAGPLLIYGSGQADAVQSVLDFIQRPDLTPSTRSELIHSLSSLSGLPQAVNQALVKQLEDPSAEVRIAALVAYADSTTEFHALAKNRVDQMANDTREDPRVRQLAIEAAAGKTHLDPNIGSQPQSPEQP